MQSTLGNLWKRRHLLKILVSTNLKRQNKNTTLGYLWWLLDPIMMTGVYFIVVVVFFKRGDAKTPYLLFLLLGLLSWKAFAGAIGQSVLLMRNQGVIIKSISFPKAVLPLSIVLSNAVHFVVALLVAVGLALWYGPEWGTWPNLTYLMLPVVIFLQVMLTVGLALMVATLGVFFHDTANIMSHLLRMWFFLSPILYSLERVPAHLQPIFRINPFCELMSAYRAIFLHAQMPEGFDLAYLFGTGLASCVFGYLIFMRFEGRLVQKL